MMQYVNWKCENRVGYISLNRPEKRNALNAQMVADLKSAFQLASDTKECKVVVVKSTGTAFCAGADLDYLQQLQKNTFEENLEDSSSLMELFRTIYTFPKVVITEVNGPAIAGGCGLATVADYCFASSNSSFGYTEVRIGFVPAIVMVFLLRKIGEGRAKEILLSGGVFDAVRAHKLGLINEVIPEEELTNHVNGFAQKLIHKNSKTSMALVKKMIAEIPELSLDEALSYAARKNAEMRETDDCKQGISSFLNKEKPTWD